MSLSPLVVATIYGNHTSYILSPSAKSCREEKFILYKYIDRKQVKLK